MCNIPIICSSDITTDIYRLIYENNHFLLGVFETEYFHATKKINKQKLSQTRNLPKGILYPVPL